MTSTSRGAIRDVCIALAHSWKPGRIFVILTAFLDESGTHGGDGTDANPPSASIVMAGMMGTAAQWGRFAAKADAMRHGYGFRIFHAKDFVKETGEFKGWGRPKMVSFIKDFGNLIQPPHLMEGVTFRVGNTEFESEFRSERPKRVSLDSAYGFCFRNCVYHLAREAERRLGHHRKWPETRLHFVLELGHKNAGDAARIFKEIKEDFESSGISILGSLSFLTKQDSIELTIGDFLAYTVWAMDRSLRAGEHTEAHLFGESERGESNITHIRFGAGGLAKIREELIKTAQRRKWQKAKAAPSSSGKSDARESF